MERSSSARASSAPAEAEEGMDPDSWRSKLKMSSCGWRGTDEALMEEASRYDAGPSPLSQLGHQGYSSSSSSWGNTEAIGALEGLDYGAEGELGCFEPSVGRNKAASTFGDWSGHS